jgi:integrase/recombinase XerD
MIEPRDANVRAWVAGLRAGSPHTARSYQDAVERFLAYVGKPVEEVTVRDAMAYIGTLADNGLARASVAHHISAVRSFLRHCQALGILPQSPLDALKRPRVAITSMNRYLTPEECQRLLPGARQVSQGAHTAVAILLGTGLRVAELAAAQWRHVFEDPQGNVGLLVAGKGGKERVVAIRDDLWRILVEERRRRSLPTELCASDASPLVADRDGTAPSTMTIWRWVRASAAVAGIDKPLSPHWLRHTFGTLTALGGANVFQIQQAMGHSAITTSQRYVHWARGLADSAAHRLPIELT